MAHPSALYRRHAGSLGEADELLAGLGAGDRVDASRSFRQDAAISYGERQALGSTELILALARIVARQDERLQRLEARLEASAPKESRVEKGAKKR